MPSHRGLRIAEAIREVVSSSILFDVADPRVRAVTVLNVDVAKDLRNATIYVSVMGTPSEQQMALKGLKSATGFLQAKVAARLQTRFTPILVFKRDDSVKRSVEISKLIEETLASDREKIAIETGSEAREDSPASSNDEAEWLDDDDDQFDDDDEDDDENDDEEPNGQGHAEEPRRGGRPSRQ